MINCRVCGKDVANDAKICPHCGADRPNISSYKKNYIIIGVLFLSVSAYGFIDMLWKHDISGFIVLPIIMLVLGVYGINLGVTGKDPWNN